MGDDVAVSWQGMQQLIDLTRDQYLNLSEASGFMCSGELNNVGAFSGFLSVFRGTYQNALDTVTDSLNDAMDAAHRLSTTIGDVRDDLRATDTGVGQLNTRIEAAVTSQPYTPGDGGGGFPQVNDQVVNVNNNIDVDWPMPGPKPPGWVPGGSVGDPLDMVDNTASMIDNASNMGEGRDHIDDADDFIEEHGR